jgi:hypothetical protein
MQRYVRRLTISLALELALVGCGGAADATVSGTLSGLASGRSITLEDNGSGDLTLTSDGNFTFATTLATGATYDVTVSAQPVAQSCAVSNGSGTVNSTTNVTGIAVTCVVTASVVVAVSGLKPGTSVTLSNGMQLLAIAADGTYAFAGLAAAGAAYAVAVAVQPVGETCTLAGASGTIPASGLATVTATCL